MPLSHEVRETDNQPSLWSGYRDELVATAMTLSLLVLGTFLVTERVLFPSKTSTTRQVTTPSTQASSVPQTLGAVDESNSADEVEASPTLTESQKKLIDSLIASEGARVYSEVPYGEDGFVQYPSYSIALKNPRLSFDKTTNGRRQFMVDIVVKNTSITEGIDIRLTASIVKDGKTIVKAAALSIPDSRGLGIGEKLSTTASLPLIDGTDVQELVFKPGHNLPEGTHYLNP
jgi:hypothetical protein